MNFNAPSPNYFWKVAMFCPSNIAAMLATKIFECMELPLNWIYVLLQDVAMWIELRHRCRGVDWSQLTLAKACELVMRAGWPASLYVFSSIGIHSVMIRDLFVSKPEYCEELNERLGLPRAADYMPFYLHGGLPAP